MLETGIAADQGGFNQGGVAFARQSFVGLQGDIGTVTLGRQYTPYFLTLNGVDPFASGMAGAALNVMANSGIRMSNTVKYGHQSLPVVSPVNWLMALEKFRATAAHAAKLVGPLATPLRRSQSGWRITTKGTPTIPERPRAPCLQRPGISQRSKFLRRLLIMMAQKARPLRCSLV